MDINNKLKSILESSIKHKEKERLQEIDNFKDKFSLKNKCTIENKNTVYENALTCAMDILFDCITLSFEEILNEFSTSDNVLINTKDVVIFYPSYTYRYRIQDIKHNDTVILPLEIAIPKRFDKNLNKSVDIIFRVSWMYRNDVFIKKCNEYYNKFGIQITFENISKSGKWKIELKTINNCITRDG